MLKKINTQVHAYKHEQLAETIYVFPQDLESLSHPLKLKELLKLVYTKKSEFALQITSKQPVSNQVISYF